MQSVQSNFFFYFLIFLFIPLSASPACLANMLCQVGQACSCAVPAASAHEQYFHFIFTPIQKNHIYQCQLSSDFGQARFVEGGQFGSIFPQGATYKLSALGPAELPILPVKIEIDTSNMVNDVGEVSLGVRFPACDLVDNTYVSCVE